MRVSVVGSILIAVFVFGFIILSHEVGHYIAARWAGITISEFAIGMGPVVYSRTDKLGIQYSFRLLPIGGFLAMEGEDEESDDPNSFSRSPAYKRAVVILSGAVVNLICGFIVLLFLANTILVGTTTVLDFDDYNSGSSQVLQAGDEILAINGSPTYVSSDVNWQLFRAYDGIVSFTVRRDGQRIELPPVEFRLEDQGDGFMAIDIDFWLLGRHLPFNETFVYSAKWAVSLMRQIWGSVGEIVTGKIPMSQLSGPVGVTSAIGQAAGAGMPQLLMMTAFIMINIGLVNLLPLPMLDGGKFILIAVEWLTGFKLNERVEAGINMFGFACLMLLMVYVTFHDFLRIIK